MAFDGSTRVRSRGPVLRAASLFGFFLALALAVAGGGCSQEGRTIQNPVVVQGIAVDVSARADTSDTSAVTTTMDVVFKVQVAFANRCEAEKTALEIHSEGPTSSPTYVITPVARYEADDACNIGANGDTVLTLTVDNVTVINAGFYSFAVRGDIPVEIALQADSSLATVSDSATVYAVQVQDKDTGAALAGALVRLERADTTELIGETTTDAQGRATVVENLLAPCGSARTPPLSTPYTLKVTFSGRSTILRMKTQPARCGVPERVVVRV